MHITKKVIDDMVFQGKSETSQDIRWDDQLSGFGVRVFPSGKKTFVIRYRANGIKRYFTLGTYGPLTLHHAKEMAKRKLVEVIDGKDPQAIRKKKSQEKRMNDLIDDFIENYAKVRKKSWRTDYLRMKKHVKPRIGNMRVSVIKRSDLITMHRDIGKTQRGTANRVIQTLGKVFEFAIDYGYLEEDAKNPCRRIGLFPEIARDRFVTHEEMPELAKAIDQEKNIYGKNLIWLYLLTGCRRNELKYLKWTAVDWNRKQIKISITKNGKPHFVPITDPILQILKQLPKQVDNPYVFCGIKQGRPIANINHVWDRARERSGLHDVRLHDLRRTVGSWLAIKGTSLPLIGKVLNHSNVSTTLIYSRFSQDPVNEIMNSHAHSIAEFIPKNDKPILEIVRPCRKSNA